MKVKELIKYLQECDEDLEVVVADSTDDLIDDDITDIDKVIEFRELSDYSNGKRVGIILD